MKGKLKCYHINRKIKQKSTINETNETIYSKLKTKNYATYDRITFLFILYFIEKNYYKKEAQMNNSNLEERAEILKRKRNLKIRKLFIYICDKN